MSRRRRNGWELARRDLIRAALAIAFGVLSGLVAWLLLRVHLADAMMPRR